MKKTKSLTSIATKHFTHKRGRLGRILTMAALFLAVENARALQFTKLFDFDGTNGNVPYAALVVSENTLYGTTLTGSTNGNCFEDADGTGTIFRINTDGTGFTNLYSFSPNCGPNFSNNDGAEPYGSLVLSGIRLYGTAHAGGTWGSGTIFAINTDGTAFTNLYNFSLVSPATSWANSDGANPVGDLVLSGNALYGVAHEGGLYANGAVFKVNIDGMGFSNLHNFTALTDAGTNSDGVNPSRGLVYSGNALYGTTFEGGSGEGGFRGMGCGVVFKINTNGSGFTVLHSFSTTIPGGYNSDGANPVGRLTLSGNTLYGTTGAGGSEGFGTLFRINTDGTGFTNLYDFNDSNGAYSCGDLVLSGNTLYGATSGSGRTCGTLFQVNTNGTDFTNLYSFSYVDPSNGKFPVAGLVLSGNTLYGTTSAGGDNEAGVVFALSPSRPVIKSIVLNTNDTVTIFCSGDTGFAYLMVAATNLAPPVPWQTISTNVADTNGNWQFTDFSRTNMVYGCFTNLVYTNSGSPFDPGNTNPPVVIGTNVWCGGVPATPIRFYRAATMP